MKTVFLLFVLSMISFMLYLSGWAEKASVTTQLVIAAPVILLAIRWLYGLSRMGSSRERDIGYYSDYGETWHSLYDDLGRNFPSYTREAEEQLIRAAEIANQRKNGRLLDPDRDIHISFTLTNQSSWDTWLNARFLQREGPQNGVYLHLTDKRTREWYRIHGNPLGDVKGEPRREK